MQALKNCQSSLKKLDEFLEITKKNPSEIMKSGVIQAFEYNFELFWKLFQKIAAQEGQSVNSPRQAFIIAYQMGLIKDENVWLNLLNDRNLTTHTYHENIAEQVYTNIRDHYYFAFKEALLAVMENLKKYQA